MQAEPSPVLPSIGYDVLIYTIYMYILKAIKYLTAQVPH